MHCIAFYFSESTRTEPVMQLILDRDEYDYEDYNVNGKQLPLGFRIYISFMTKPFR